MMPKGNGMTVCLPEHMGVSCQPNVHYTLAAKGDGPPGQHTPPIMKHRRGPIDSRMVLMRPGAWPTFRASGGQ